MTHELVKIFVRGVYKAAGLDSPYSQKEYGANWSKQRRKCLERDGRACRVCGQSGDEMSREPAVHHVTPRSRFDDSEWRTYNDLDNLVTLCHSCHGTLEGRHPDCTADEFVTRARQDNV